MNEHVRLAMKGSHYNRYLSNIIKKAGGELPSIVIRENLTSQQACDMEVAFIAAIGRTRDGGPLVNMTDGGDGHHGMEEDVRLRISAKLTGRKMSPEKGAAVSVAMKASEAVAKNIARLADAKRGVPHTPEHNAAISEGRLRGGYVPTLEHRANWSRVRKGVRRGPMQLEALARRREKTKDRVVSAETCEKLRRAALRQHARRRGEI